MKKTLRYSFTSREDAQALTIEGDGGSDWFFSIEGDRLFLGRTREALAAVRTSDRWLGYDSGVYVREGSEAARIEAEATVSAEKEEAIASADKASDERETCLANQRTLAEWARRYRADGNGDQPISVIDFEYVGYIATSPVCPTTGAGYSIDADDSIAPCSVHGRP